MAQGIVKWFNNSKGFGFIDACDGGSDVFAHYSAIEMEGYKTLPQGATVSYEMVEGPKGRHAMAIVLVSKPPRPVEETEHREARSSRLRTPQFRANMNQARSM